jgi:hypothetical protein
MSLSDRSDNTRPDEIDPIANLPKLYKIWEDGGEDALEEELIRAGLAHDPKADPNPR